MAQQDWALLLVLVAGALGGLYLTMGLTPVDVLGIIAETVISVVVSIVEGVLSWIVSQVESAINPL